MNFKNYLTDDVLAFWLKNAFDDEFGGIFTQIDREGKIYGTENSGPRALDIFQGLQLR